MCLAFTGAHPGSKKMEEVLWRLQAFYRQVGGKENYAKAGENYRKAGQEAVADRPQHRDIVIILVHHCAGLDVHHGLRLASTRLQTALAQHFGTQQDEITNCRTYGGHGEQMAVFASTARVQGKPLTDLIGTDDLSDSDWAEIKQRVCQGGKRIIQLRGRSSFQSPAHQSILLVRSVLTGEPYPWPVGVYVNNDHFSQIMMAMETSVSDSGVSYQMPEGTEAELRISRA